MPKLNLNPQPTAVGPYLGLLAYARAAGAPDADASKRLVDDVLAEDETTPLPLLIERIEARARVILRGGRN